MMLWDCECEKCNHIWEAWSEGVEADSCPKCGSAFTKLLPGGGGTPYKAKDPYSYLDRGPPDNRKIQVGSTGRKK